MATIGQQLTSPEAGWKRYDDTDSAISYSGYSYISSSGDYLNTKHQSNILGSTIKFRFIGTKIRIITTLATTGSNNQSISIDGVEETYGSQNSTIVRQVVVYEKIGLPNGVHEVVIRLNDSNYSILDAIDIDDTGRLLHPDEVLDPKDLDIGKRIRCHYQAFTSGQVGVFSGLGQETSDFIPASSSATPNGDFYFICVDKDYLGRWKLIADRNIQHSISWDTLNSEGMTNTGREINLNLNNYKFTIRLLTGGINSSDKDNEWDKYIVNSTLNGTITAGDNNVWNWSGVYSWTSTTPNGSSANRVERGYSSASTYTSATSSTSSTSIGFRPVLLIESVSDTTSDTTPSTSNNLSQSLYKLESGLLFIDDFNSMNSRWTVSPLDSYSITERQGYLRMKHNVSYDTLALTDIPAYEEVAIEVFADYNPTEPGDEGGIIIWKNASEKIEFLEKFDSESTFDHISWLAVKNGTDWRFFSNFGNGYVFIDSDVIDANKFGMVVKKGNSSNFVNLDVDKVIVTKGNKITITNVRLGGKVALLDSNGVEISSDYATSVAAVQLTIPTLEFNGTLVVYDENNNELCRIDATFHGGDVYGIGSTLEIRYNGSELSKTSQTDIGVMTSGVLEVQMEIHNPSISPVYNIQISIAQYLDKFGWTWADIALDNGGSPGVYGDSISIGQLQPGESVPFWLKVVKGTDYHGFEPIQFNINVTHD